MYFTDKMPVTAPHENMDVDSDDHNIEEASTSQPTVAAAATDATASTSSGASTSAKSLANDSTVSNVMASPSTIPSVTVSLHPLVIMNISEHWTRIRAQEGLPSQGTNFNFALIQIICSVVRLVLFSFSNWCSDWQTNWSQHWGYEFIRIEIFICWRRHHHLSGLLPHERRAM